MMEKKIMLGNIFILASLIAGIFSVITYYYTFRGYTNTLVLARRGYYLMTLFAAAASVFSALPDIVAQLSV